MPHLLRILLVVVAGPACAWALGEYVIPEGQRGTNAAFVLAVLVAVVVAGVWWGIASALVSLALITYFFVEPRGHLTGENLPAIAVFAGTVAVTGALVRRLTQARDDAHARLDEREAALAELARLYEREREVTRAFQAAALQDQLPVVASADIEAFYKPALSMYEIGGDWYDILRHADGRVTFVVGDVAGKGIQAAAEMVRLSKALRLYAAEGYAPGEVLSRADAAMYEGVLREAFATAVCATFDPAELTLEYCSAGHPSPLLVTASGEHVFLDECANAPLTSGVVDGRSEVVRLAPGDAVLFYTDGLIERRDRPLDEGFDDLAAACATARETGWTLEQLVASLTANSASDDDICAVRLTVSGVKERADVPPVEASAAR